MNRALGQFSVDGFQLGDVDRVSIGGTCGYACDLSRSAGCFVTYGKSRHLSLPCADEIAYFFLRCIISLLFLFALRFKLIILSL